MESSAKRQNMFLYKAAQWFQKMDYFYVCCYNNLLMLKHLEMNLGAWTLTTTVISFDVLTDEFLCEKMSEEYSSSFLYCKDPTY